MGWLLEEDVGAGEVEGVEEGGIDSEGGFAGAGDLELGDEEPIEGAGAFGEEFFKGAANVAFVVEPALGELIQSFVIGLDGGVSRLQFELGHAAEVTLTGNVSRERRKWVDWGGAAGWGSWYPTHFKMRL